MASDAEIARAKQLFPKMPPAVFDLWIVPGIESHGWQFTSVFQSVNGTEWDGFFADRPLAWWASADWELSQYQLRRELLRFESKRRIDWIIDNNTKGIETPTANLRNTKERFRALEDFIRANGVLPNPAVGFWFGSQIYVVDGHHRLAALFHVGFKQDFMLAVWIASLPK